MDRIFAFTDRKLIGPFESIPEAHAFCKKWTGGVCLYFERENFPRPHLPQYSEEKFLTEFLQDVLA